MKYDLLLTDGEVLDPGAGLNGRMDVGIAGGKVIAVGPNLPQNEARRMISAKRRLIAQMTLRDGRVCYERPPE